MTQAAITPEENVPDSPPQGEKFLAVTVRRSRFAVSIILSGLMFWTLGWMVAAPAAPHQALTLLGWGGSGGGVVIQTVALLVMVVAGAVLSMLITHPDSPHAGLFCVLLGLGALAIRGGPITPLLIEGDKAAIENVYTHLAIECAFWAAIIFIAELVTARIHQAMFKNTAWIERIAENPAAFQSGTFNRGAVGHGGVSLADAILQKQADRLNAGKTKPMHMALANTLALLVAGVVASILLPAFMQSQLKGQVLFAAFISFGIAGFVGNVALSQSNAWPVILCVPLTVAIGYLRATAELHYPGFSASAIARALPVDYIATGVPGALFGYYASVRWRLSHLFESEVGDEK